MYASQRTNYRNRELAGNRLWSGGSPTLHCTLLFGPGNETGGWRVAGHTADALQICSSFIHIHNRYGAFL
ncbi:hypothetical protein D3C74_416260 [compost metagenome]